MSDETYGYDDFNVDDGNKGGNGSDIGMQGFRGCSKYLPEVPPAVEIKSGGKFRFFPAVDTENQNLLPPVQNGKLTFVDFEAGINYCGLVFGSGDDKTYRRINMWITPSDMDEVYPDERATITNPVKWQEFCTKNSPYKVFKDAMVNSKKDSKTPPEWNNMCFDDSFKDLMDHMEGSSENIYSAAVPNPQLKTVGMGGLITASNKDKDFSNENDLGMLYPAVFEFNKSATQFIRSAELVEQAKKDFAKEPDNFTMEYLTHCEKGRALKAENKRIGDEGQGTYYQTQITVPSARETIPIDSIEVVKSWYPLREETTVEWEDEDGQHAEDRPALINLLTIEEQIEWLIWAFGPIPVDYAFNGTAFSPYVPDSIVGLFGQFTEEYGIPETGDWWKLHRRDVLQGKDRTVKDGVTNGTSISKEEVQQNASQFNQGGEPSTSSSNSNSNSNSNGMIDKMEEDIEKRENSEENTADKVEDSSGGYSYGYSGNDNANNSNDSEGGSDNEATTEENQPDGDYDENKANDLRERLNDKGYSSE